MSGFMHATTVFLPCRHSKMQANNTMSLCRYQAYSTHPKKETSNSNTDREYEVIPPLMHETASLNEADVNNDGENSNVQTSQNTIQLHQQASPGQPNEEVEHNSHMQQEQLTTESSEHKDLTGNDNVYHTFKSKAEDNEDQAAPYEVPIPTLMKLRIKNERAQRE